VPATPLAVAGDAWPVVAQVLDSTAAVLAAEQVGVAERALEISVEYAKLRHQFGRPIGSFQAVKHQLADVLLGVESARMAAYYALLRGADEGAFPAAASLAKAFCSETCMAATETMIQVHGGVGFTWEHPAHLYLKRARSSVQLLGDPAYHRERLAGLVGI
jgi:alkylation response protein AidB-like acyl-CoA dehydrogenase